VTALPIENLSLFIATVQGLTKTRTGIDELKMVVEKLLHFPLRASLVETDIFKSRISDYSTHYLDSLISTTELEWFGVGKEQVAFRFTGEREITGSAEYKEALPDFVPDKHAHYTYFTLLQNSGLDSATFSDDFWKLVWSGIFSCDTYESVRKGVLVKFGKKTHSKEQRTVVPDKSITRRFRPVGFDRWKATSVFPGNWYFIESSDIGTDPIIEDDLCRERIRIVLSRYGILFRELLINELPAFQWGRIFRTLRIMELSGEVLTGHFFEGIPGLQFVNYTALALLKKDLDSNALYWINATDPASLCGISLHSLKSKFPLRIPSAHLIYQGTRLIVVSHKNGKELDCRFEKTDQKAMDYCKFLSQLALSGIAPMSSKKIEKINSEPVFDSDLTECFEKTGYVREYKCLAIA
jgi:ATP-dependent Lhr-like helicase